MNDNQKMLELINKIGLGLYAGRPIVEEDLIKAEITEDSVKHIIHYLAESYSIWIFTNGFVLSKMKTRGGIEFSTLKRTEFIERSNDVPFHIAVTCFSKLVNNIRLLSRTRTFRLTGIGKITGGTKILETGNWNDRRVFYISKQENGILDLKIYRLGTREETIWRRIHHDHISLIIKDYIRPLNKVYYIKKGYYPIYNTARNAAVLLALEDNGLLYNSDFEGNYEKWESIQNNIYKLMSYETANNFEYMLKNGNVQLRDLIEANK
jgi:hypothetical protein